MPTLAEMHVITGISKQTLINWRRNRPQLWVVIIAGTNSIKEGKQ